MGTGEVNLEEKKLLSLLGFTAIVTELVLKVSSALSHTKKIASFAVLLFPLI